jgi:hypothetical protein
VGKEIQIVAMIRKPFYVNAVLVTEENIENVATWCNGTIVLIERNRSKNLIKCVQIEDRRAQADWQRQARVGDWVVSAGKGFKVYTNKALRASFDVIGVEVEEEQHYLHPSITEEELEHRKNASDAERVLEAERVRRLLEPDCL